MATRIYFDNAATTPLDPRVFEAMTPFFTEHFGNPSSIYSYGRENRLSIEKCRKTVAHLLGAHPSELFFTSGGTESTNAALHGAVHELGCTRIITSPIEHHATLHTCEKLHKSGRVSLEFVKIDAYGHVDLSHLENLLSSSDQKTLVSLMHANNEIGNITAIQEVGEICKRHNAIFHADTVQTVGHFPIDLSTIYVHFITASGHKFHGPKGTGILYIRSGTGIGPYIHGGGQERNMRAGTENIYGIVGFTKALELAYETMSSDSHYISELKSYALQQLQDHIPGISFNGDPQGRSLYTVLNVGFPVNDRTEMMLLNLDIHHICASGGSACSSGADQGSHVIKALSGPPQVTIRFSFSKYNTKAEIDKMVSVLRRLI